jgi:hypothetical protein
MVPKGYKQTVSIKNETVIIKNIILLTPFITKAKIKEL